ncbi:MAG: hypothetical protein Q607_CBUC00185G0015 [Clostridium butyricum DORA_1]|nr:MAG: hypothetical protein Q607_CBUC00185G0015 [Clostridium butyricum DORA_1]
MSIYQNIYFLIKFIYMENELYDFIQYLQDFELKLTRNREIIIV